MAIHPMPELLPDIVIQRARQLNAAQLADGMKGLGIPNDGCMDAGILPVDLHMRVVGTAMTVDTRDGDNFPIHVATYSGKPGYVMVIDGKGCPDKAYFGDLIMGAASAIGYEGMICDGYVRDRAGCIELGMPVFARGFMQRGPGKQDPGEINLPVRCGGITVSPGDLVVGDYDGVTVVPRDRIEEVLSKAEEKKAYEEKREETISAYRAAVQAGTERPELAPAWVLDMLNNG